MAGSLWRWSCTYGSEASQHRAVLTAAAIRKRKQVEAAAQRAQQAEDEPAATAGRTQGIAVQLQGAVARVPCAGAGEPCPARAGDGGEAQ